MGIFLAFAIPLFVFALSGAYFADRYGQRPAPGEAARRGGRHRA